MYARLRFYKCGSLECWSNGGANNRVLLKRGVGEEEIEGELDCNNNLNY